MNCDEAFDLITHPTDHNCEELQWHLQLCPRCRQMKETLAPALDTFQQILDDVTDVDQLSQFHADFHQTSDQESASIFPKTGQPFLSAETVRMAEQAASRLRAESVTNQMTKPSQKPKPHQKRLVHAALILLVGFLMGWGISLNGPENQFSPSVSSLQSQQPCLWIAQRESRANQPAKTAREKGSASNVVLSCVACHLQSTAE
ncbi:hypothetical protein [uncultured Gimesia sp.]|jgi:hypothetical protein|uniref:hypothetical protein n=1 Tax=uncultured Gimesia sp. TaxID=1678688 RepID=UPI00260521E6|nr:hypothetical protein [uncultured Gimesia sp.]